MRTFLWTAGIPQLNKLIFDGILKGDRPRKTIVVNLILNKETNCEKLHYIFCYKKDLSILRVNNTYNYCPDFKSNYGYPINV